MPSKSVLVIEDDHESRVGIRSTLEEEGFKVLTATNGRDGLAMLQKTKPSLILLDLMMPIMDGYEFLREFRAHDGLNDIPIVVLSAARFQKKPEGIQAFYPKPVELHSLLNIVQKFCAA